ncbi:unnamed protein product, partial [Symbiodinium microadriaticum]
VAESSDAQGHPRSACNYGSCGWSRKRGPRDDRCSAGGWGPAGHARSSSRGRRGEYARSSPGRGRGYARSSRGKGRGYARSFSRGWEPGYAGSFSR